MLARPENQGNACWTDHATSCSTVGTITMPETIRVDEERGIIHVQDYDNVSKEDVDKSISEARHILATKGIDKILVDTTKIETMPNTLAIYDVFSTMPGEFKIAMLVQESQATAREFSFGETVASNRGLRVKIFNEKDRALEWLVS